MIFFVSIVHVIVCLILILMILLQAGKGNGLAGAAFTGSSEQSVFGTKTADVMTKATAVSAILFLITCISLSAITARKTRSLYGSYKNQAPITMSQVQRAINEAMAKSKTAAPAASVPAAPVNAPVAATPAGEKTAPESAPVKTV